jgi:hypothetical protein
MKREKYPTRTIVLVGSMQKDTARILLEQAPIDMHKPLELVIREQQKERKLDQNSLMWVSQLADISAQAYVNGRTYSAELWHEFFKREYLPDEYDPELCKEGYRKWDYSPGGERVLIGSTTELTIKGFAQYLTQIEAHGASLGVMFGAGRRMAA